MVAQGARRRRAIGALEMACVVAVIALLMTLGVVTYRGTRLTARVAVAESNLKQISTGMELYFRKYSTYPPQGCDLAQELAPFVDDPEVFANPLMDEAKPGQTISLLYRAPTSGELDHPHCYLTAMLADDGITSVVLRTGNRIERHGDYPFNPEDPRDFHAALGAAPVGAQGGGGEEGGGSLPPGDVRPPDPPPTPGYPILGSININPNNRGDEFEFSMQKTDGSTITRDDLLASDRAYIYTGPAVEVRVCPKGNGNQNSLTVNDQPYDVRNGTLYIIRSSFMWVKLTNTNDKGKAMGKWWITIIAFDATITTGL